MSNRYSNIERLGVIETDKIVTKYLGWIFREQPIVDVGIDALIEQSEQGNPTGKFIAIQIKSGKSNFHESENYFTHYVSHIHYNYWLNLDIPIILVAHLPETEKTYWQYICEKNFKKTRRKWKIEIPKKQEFNKNAKSRLINILSNKEDKSFVFDLFKGKVEPNTLFDFAENVNCIGESVDSVYKIINVISELNDKTNEFNIKLTKYVKDNLSDKDSQVKASINGFGKNLNVCSKRLENELEIFSELFSEGFLAYHNVVISHYLITKEPNTLLNVNTLLEKIPESVDYALESINVMRNSISKIPTKYSVLKEAKITLLEVVDLLINEFNESKEIVIKIKKKLN
jgi:hypothetical protein